MKNFKNNKSFNPLGTQKVFKNVPADVKFNPLKMFYGTITTDKGSFVTTYETTTRSEAVRVFEADAKSIGGKLDKFVGAFKK